MTEYLLGLATLPFVALVFLFWGWFLSPPRWDSKGPCPWCDQGKVWDRMNHPLWPWWLWRLDEELHQIRFRERQQIKAWQAENTVKDHWWSKRRIVR